MSNDQLPDWNALSKDFPLDSAGAHWVLMVTCAQPRARKQFLLSFTEGDDGFVVSNFKPGSTHADVLVTGKHLKQPGTSSALVTYHNEKEFNKTDLIRLIAVFKLSIKVDL